MINEQTLKDRVQGVARERNIHFNACWKQLLLERFLARLAGSPHSNKFIFKGGFLLSYLMKIGRETTDLDFLLTRMKAEKGELQETFEEIISIHSADGFTFSFDSIELLSQPHMDYPGYRVILSAVFEKMKDKIQVDIGVGDIVEPLAREIPLVQYRGKPFFENAISLLVYPVETIFSEKLETILSKGAGNSRMKDYHDLILLIRNEEMLDSNKLKDSVTNTFTNRGTSLRTIEFDENALKALQRLWAGHLRGLGNNAQDFDLPGNISVVIEEVNKYIVTIPLLPKIERISLGSMIADMKGKPLIEKVKEALAAGADVNDDTRNGHRPLQLALTHDHTEVAKLLIESGADLRYRDRSGRTPLQAAINHGQFKNAELLIKKGVPFNKHNLNLEFDYVKHYQFTIGR